MESMLLPLITFLPLMGMIGVLLIPGHRHKVIRTFTVLVTFVVRSASIFLHLETRPVRGIYDPAE